MLTPAHPRPEAREKAAIVVDVQKAQRLRWHRRPDPKVTAQVHVREVVHRLAGQAFVELHAQYVVRAPLMRKVQLRGESQCLVAENIAADVLIRKCHRIVQLRHLPLHGEIRGTKACAQCKLLDLLHRFVVLVSWK